jgi:hypothetical protein
LEIAAALFTLLALCFNEGFYQDALGGGRVLCPLLIFLVLRNTSVVWCLPLMFVAMRTWLQVLSPLLSIVKGVVHYGR